MAEAHLEIIKYFSLPQFDEYKWRYTCVKHICTDYVFKPRLALFKDTTLIHHIHAVLSRWLLVEQNDSVEEFAFVGRLFRLFYRHAEYIAQGSGLTAALM